MQLIIGNKNYSSWSLRAWWLLKSIGVPFNEVLVPLAQADTRATLLQYTPSGLVPVLLNEEVGLWDTLAITEYLNERNLGVWPVDHLMRAYARAVSAEMHSGFTALRSEMPMNCRARLKLVPSLACVADIERICAIWRDCRLRYGHLGPWLFGKWSAADAFFAPVVMRFNSYGVELDDVCFAYLHTVWFDPYIREWVAAAELEPWSYPATDAIAQAAQVALTPAI
ncbi:glutathione S-transferase family protein [Hydromonas duriensis]|uniref:Glutathione S-transferase n=1 Tax=Hydromonas duriensis TaxID=1527608 RepID=A0A4R6Y7E9_9BURK|nr:glutathione S-transferase family protein [Hydromonas duriensis]TDR31247.1 glutathione S-transferase [Hydromonas duriensis]